jgi:hypothetical protein
MRSEFLQLPMPAFPAGGPGASIDVSGLEQKFVQIGGSFTATVAVEGTINGADWVAVASVTGPMLIQVIPVFAGLRVNVTGYSSGPTPTAMVSGFNRRTE